MQKIALAVTCIGFISLTFLYYFYDPITVPDPYARFEGIVSYKQAYEDFAVLSVAVEHDFLLSKDVNLTPGEEVTVIGKMQSGAIYAQKIVKRQYPIPADD